MESMTPHMSSRTSHSRGRTVVKRRRVVSTRDWNFAVSIIDILDWNRASFVRSNVCRFIHRCRGSSIAWSSASVGWLADRLRGSSTG